MKLVFLSESNSAFTFGTEIVERKGIGHPDTICDALAEEISLALSRYYVEQFGRVLHHNVDKVLLRGGTSHPVFGGGEIIAPIEICLGGRATAEAQGQIIPVKDIALAAARSWFRKNLGELNPEKDIHLNCLIRPGSADLVELFLRGKEPLSNDTSVGVGFAPYSQLEQTVLGVDAWVHKPEARAQYPMVGTDTKVMGVQDREGVELTVACAFISRHIPSLESYFKNKAQLQESIELIASRIADTEVKVILNAADSRENESVYLTVSGTSAEAGDDGQVGRGNRVSGLITPSRPMSLEAAAGKNPVSHTGKIYQVAAHHIARALVSEVEGIERADCFLVSQIGSPISQPKEISIRTKAKVPENISRDQVEELVRGELTRLPRLWEEILSRGISVY